MKEEIFKECLTRMEILKLDKSCIDKFKEGIIWESESIGALYDLNDNEKRNCKRV